MEELNWLMCHLLNHHILWHFLHSLAPATHRFPRPSSSHCLSPAIILGWCDFLLASIFPFKKLLHHLMDSPEGWLCIFHLYVLPAHHLPPRPAPHTNLFNGSFFHIYFSNQHLYTVICWLSGTNWLNCLKYKALICDMSSSYLDYKLFMTFRWERMWWGRGGWI